MRYDTDVIIVGAGVGGLVLALSLHQAGIACRVYEAVSEIKPLGVGINLLPHATRELDELGLLPALDAIAVRTRESVFYTRHGQFIYGEPAGLTPATTGRNTPSIAAICKWCCWRPCGNAWATVA